MTADLSFFERLPQYNRYKVEFIYSCLENLLILRPGPTKILDVGCGTGELLTLPLAQLFLSNLNVTILGTNVHEGSIQRAIKNLQ